jgi:hypothetical protein
MKADKASEQDCYRELSSNGLQIRKDTMRILSP